jgi:hypothetical protein
MIPVLFQLLNVLAVKVNGLDTAAHSVLGCILIDFSCKRTQKSL